ncbi:hypothetical protein LTR82_015074 [Friedmanniomyces endolithicus]|uniref:Uncharacterized protein n=1 Tax=Friedmanniomyces endolithicus TaxID=329885 RepID=A0AAN6J2D6_9PEZI|nr:hypothetical protein LTR82_015074 [Friedmanniomyces endolithicus]
MTEPYQTGRVEAELYKCGKCGQYSGRTAGTGQWIRPRSGKRMLIIRQEQRSWDVGDKLMMKSPDDNKPGKVKVEVKELKDKDGVRGCVVVLVGDPEKKRYHVTEDELEFEVSTAANG